MSDEILYTMSQQIGELNGTVKTALAAQESTNKALFGILEKYEQRMDAQDEAHDKRIKPLEEARTRLIGAAIFSSLGGSTIGATVMKFFGMGAPPHP